MYKCILAGAILAACSLEASAFSPSAPALRIGGRPCSIQGSPLLVGKSMAKLQAANRRTVGSKIQMQAAGSLSFGKTQVVEAMEEQSATVIFMHGLGDTGGNWKKLSEAISIPYVKWMFPTAPMRDVTISDGMSMPGWFDIEGLKVSEMRADSEGIQQSIDHVKKVIDEEIASGTPSDRIVLAGFSQGGVIALGAAMQAEHCLGGVMALSTWFPRGIADTPEKVNSKLPVLVCHGENDPIAKADWGRKTFDYLTELGMPTEGNIYPDMGHEFKPAEVLDVKNFLSKVIGAQMQAKLSKPLGITMEEAEGGMVGVGSIKEGGGADKSGVIQVGDQILSVNGKSVRGQGFDAVMDAIKSAEGEIDMRLLRPPADRTVDWTTLSTEEQDRRLNNAGGILKVCTDRACMNQGSKATMRWLTELTPEQFSVTRCSCTGSCGKGPNVVVGGKGRKEKVVYETNSVGRAVKMLRDEFDLEIDEKIIDNLLNPSKNVEFALSDELVRQGLMQTVDIRSSFAGNRF